MVEKKLNLKYILGMNPGCSQKLQSRCRSITTSTHFKPCWVRQKKSCKFPHLNQRNQPTNWPPLLSLSHTDHTPRRRPRILPYNYVWVSGRNAACTFMPCLAVSTLHIPQRLKSLLYDRMEGLKRHDPRLGLWGLRGQLIK